VDGTKDPERYYTSASRATTRPDVRFSRNCVLGALFGGHFTNADGGDIHVARLNYPVRLFWIISSFCGRDACTNMLSITFTSNEVDTEGTILYNSPSNVGVIPRYSPCMRVLIFYPLLPFPFNSFSTSFAFMTLDGYLSII